MKGGTGGTAKEATAFLGQFQLMVIMGGAFCDLVVLSYKNKGKNTVIVQHGERLKTELVK